MSTARALRASQLNWGVRERHRFFPGIVTYNRDRAAEFVLALMALDVDDVGRAWKGYPWDVLDCLFERGLISHPKRKTRSVELTEEGQELAKRKFAELLAAGPEATRRRSESPPTRPSTLPDMQRALVEHLLAPFCKPPVDPAIAAKLRHGFRIDANAVTLFATRPRYDNPDEWMEEPVAKFRFNKSREVWQLYCMYRDLKWHSYEPLPESTDLARLVTEVRTDPTGIFWG